MALTVHSIDTKNDMNDLTVESFTQQSHCFNSIKLLCQLTKAVQQHRGATMGYLSGSEAFQKQIESLQSTIGRIVLLLDHLDNQEYTCIPSEQLLNINNDWKTILMGWRDDQVLHNFEFHCHLVDTLNKLIRFCMTTKLLPHLNSSGQDHQLLLDTLLIQLPNTIESLAMLRGLSTNVAVIKACGTDSHAKISFLVKEISDKNQQLSKSISQLMPEITTIKNIQKQLYKFILTIQMSIVDAPKVTANSAVLFALSTEVINAHWLAVDQGLQKIEGISYQLLLEPPSI
jgi:hypothetical protein